MSLVDAEERATPTTLVGIACISAAVLLTELGLTRILSVVTWYHFAFLAISLALFGLSASAMVIHVTTGGRAHGLLPRQLAGFALAFALLAVGSALAFVATSVGRAYLSRSLPQLIGVYLL